MHLSGEKPFAQGNCACVYVVRSFGSMTDCSTKIAIKERVQQSNCQSSGACLTSTQSALSTFWFCQSFQQIWICRQLIDINRSFHPVECQPQIWCDEQRLLAGGGTNGVIIPSQRSECGTRHHKLACAIQSSDFVVISQTISWVSQVRLATVARISVFIE